MALQSIYFNGSRKAFNELVIQLYLHSSPLSGGTTMSCTCVPQIVC